MTCIPELEPHCGSWVIIRRSTGKPVVEVFTRSNVEKIIEWKPDEYEVLTAAQWLVRFNQSVSSSDSCHGRKD